MSAPCARVSTQVLRGCTCRPVPSAGPTSLVPCCTRHAGAQKAAAAALGRARAAPGEDAAARLVQGALLADTAHREPGGGAGAVPPLSGGGPRGRGAGEHRGRAGDARCGWENACAVHPGALRPGPGCAGPRGAVPSQGKAGAGAAPPQAAVPTVARHPTSTRPRPAAPCPAPQACTSGAWLRCACWASFTITSWSTPTSSLPPCTCCWPTATRRARRQRSRGEAAWAAALVGGCGCDRISRAERCAPGTEHALLDPGQPFECPRTPD